MDGERRPGGQAINSPAWWDGYFEDHWEANGGRAQTRHFVECLVANLPPREAAYLYDRPLRIVDWGCALGEGVDVLARTFPRGEVVGLDVSATALEKARATFPGHEFVLAPDGGGDVRADVIVCSNCLEHFDEPLRMMAGQLRRCGRLYAALVPHDERPLCEQHRYRFREGSFPPRVGDFVRLAEKVIATDPRHWCGRQLLVVYGSSAYLRERPRAADCGDEEAKWSSYYTDLTPEGPDDATRRFDEELVGLVRGLLPQGGRVLEAGCGAAAQGLALARDGFEVGLLDFSAAALVHARRRFAEADLPATFLHGDVLAGGAPDHDLVFNAGALEHYGFEQQAAFVRGMARRSRRYVLALVPNRACYWYWLWRVRGGAAGHWPFGREVPPAGLGDVFRAAGLRFLGHAFVGADWTESFLPYLAGMDDRLREDVVAIHRSPLIPRAQKCYLLAALGRVDGPGEAPPGWSAGADGAASHPGPPEAYAALADALALRLGGEARLREAAERAAAKEAERREAEAALRGRIADFEKRLADSEARRADTEARLAEAEARGTDREARRADTVARLADAEGRLAERQQELAQAQGQLSARQWELQDIFKSRGWRFLQALRGLRRLAAPADGWRARLGRCFARLSGRRAPAAPDTPGEELRRLLDRHAGARDVVVFAPSVEWDIPLFQRPQQLALALARQGALVLYVEPPHTARPAGLHALGERLYLCHAPTETFRALRRPAVVVLSYNRASLAAFDAPRVVYDYIDDLDVFPGGRARLEDDHAALMRDAAVVLATADRLHRQVAAVRPDGLLCPNGVDLDHFARARSGGGPPPADLAPLLAEGRPVVGYYGALARWFDYDLLAEAARRRPGLRFVLIGPDYDGTLGASGLLRADNVRWLGPRPYALLPDYLRCFDVATVPFRLNDITHATSPLKLFEYMAGRKPVVVTAMHESMRYRGPLVAAGPDDFVARLDEALRLRHDPAHLELLDAVARENTWGARAEQVLSALAAARS
jgi:glycosyltransferase involved in cell wall biosynthesis/2-polyprenyl-3-methyl-5-hydroxy-6-metoxy-1,4-benzoquinol methylase